MDNVDSDSTLYELWLSLLTHYALYGLSILTLTHSLIRLLQRYSLSSRETRQVQLVTDNCVTSDDTLYHSTGSVPLYQ